MTSSLPENVSHKVYFDNNFSSVYLLQFLKAAGIWAVGTIKADILKGAEKVLQDKKRCGRKAGGPVMLDGDARWTMVR